MQRLHHMRFAIPAGALAALLAGLWAGLVRIGWPRPRLYAPLPAAHGPLMVCGFLGTLICLERAVALNRGRACAARRAPVGHSARARRRSGAGRRAAHG